ncbi:MAG TPA: DUF4082 domain-containing protein [Thermoanaerobaculia bacterium]|nr:DUF4082 domain-containing protein [Thermoanaerobaculia bacterium]
MRNKICLIALMLIATTVAGAAAAPRPGDSAPVPLYQIDKAASRSLAEPLVFDAAEELLIQVDPRVVARNPQTLLIDLPGQPMLEAVRTRFDVYRADWKSWFGVLRPVDGEAGPTGYIYLGFHGDRLTGDMKIAGERYRIAGGPEVGQRLVRLADELTPPSCAIGAEADAPADETQHWLTPEQAPEVGSLQEKATATIDVLAVYPGRSNNGNPEGFFQGSATDETAMRTFVQDSIATANAIFTGSVVDARYELRGVVPFLNPVDRNGEPGAGLYDTLAWLTGGGGGTPARAAEPAALRDAYGADIVAAFIPADWSETPACGAGNIPQNGSFVTAGGVIQEDLGDRAFSATRSGCGALDFTVAHEIGHNHGLRHDRPGNNPGVDLFPNGRGYVFDIGNNTWRATLMGCACRAATENLPYPVCSGSIFGAVCNRVPYYSDPSLMYPGTTIPMGDATHQEAAAMRIRVGTTSGYRTRSLNNAPNANFSVSCSGLTCTFNGNSTTDDASIPSGNFHWDFGDGQTAVGKTPTRTYSSAGNYRVHLVVTDIGGQRDVEYSTVAPWNPVYEGYVEQINCRAISGWAWDQAIPNTPISVDIFRNSTKVSTVPANVYRSDLQAAGKGNGVHAFGYTPNSSWRNGQWQTAGVRFANTSTDLVYLVDRQIICDVSMFTGITPAENNSTGGVVYSVATQFSSSRSGLITQLGFHRASGETGSNTLHLTTDSGAELASKTATCGGSGWCWVTLNQAVSITQGTRYRVWVNTNTQQSKTGCGIGGGISNGPLTAHSGYWIAGNTFPTTGSCSNFFVDVKFEM